MLEAMHDLIDQNHGAYSVASIVITLLEEQFEGREVVKKHDESCE